MKKYLLICLALVAGTALGQNKLTPELLWKLKRVGGVQVSPDKTKVLYSITEYDISTNGRNTDLYILEISSGRSQQLTNTPDVSEFNAEWHPKGDRIGFLASGTDGVQMYEIDLKGQNQKLVSSLSEQMNGFKYAPDGDHILYIADVKLDQNINEKYSDLPDANAMVFDDLMYRHWNHWHDYAYSHVFYATRNNGTFNGGRDIMREEKFDSPLNPFGGLEQITWSIDSKSIFYTCKKKKGKEYAVSTNSDIFMFDTERNQSRNMTTGMQGYDMNPSMDAHGAYMAFLSMEEDGFESDKNDIVIMDMKSGQRTNLTSDIDLTVSDYVWDPFARKIYFLAVTNATYQLFELEIDTKKHRQITKGTHNYTSLAFAGEYLIGTRQSMLEPNEIFKIKIADGSETKLTDINKDIMASLKEPKIEKRMVKTTDGKEMLTWVIYPPNFDPSKKYPTLLYCQGGPQSAVSQFFSFRWNFRLMADQGYIIVAPNRRGLPGFGQQWNDDISGDWGGQPMADYLSAIDDVSKEAYVDKEHLGCIGASYGGYSVYYLAGIHEKRFKCFISHCGLFNLESWYGSTEELFFANKDIGGPYWGADRADSYDKFSPHKLVDKWDTPILVIHGEKDFRVPVTQGMEAFQAAQLKGIPSKFLYFPTEGHWVLNPQNGMVWHREFFSWLDKWLK